MPTHFIAKSLKQILEAKEKQKKLLTKQLDFSKDKALIGIFLDNELSSKQEGMLKEFLGASASLDLQVVVLADTNLEMINESLDQHVKLLDYSKENRKNLMQAADLAFAFDFNDVQEMLINGTIPVSKKRKELENYDPNQESGFGFLFEKEDKWCSVAALVRALETYRFPYDWKTIVRSGLVSLQKN